MRSIGSGESRNEIRRELASTEQLVQIERVVAEALEASRVLAMTSTVVKASEVKAHPGGANILRYDAPPGLVQIERVVAKLSFQSRLSHRRRRRARCG